MKSKPMSFLIIILIIISAIFIFLYTKKEHNLQKESVNWPTTEAVVSSSNVRRDWDKNNGAPKTTYWFEISYNYEIEGKTYLGKRYTFQGGPSFNTKSLADALLAEFPIGKKITIYYQPDNPQEAVIKRR